MAKPQLATDNTAQVLDANTMTVEQLQAFLEKKKLEQAAMVAENKDKILYEVEAYLHKNYGINLAALGLVQKTDRKTPGERQFKNPANGEVYVYKGFGKLPAWLAINGKSKDGKRDIKVPNPAFEDKSN